MNQLQPLLLISEPTSIRNGNGVMARLIKHVQIRFSQGACNEKPEKDRPPFCFYGESIRTSVHSSHFLWKRRHSNTIVGCHLRSVAVKARQRWAASASIIYFIQSK